MINHWRRAVGILVAALACTPAGAQPTISPDAPGAADRHLRTGRPHRLG